MFGPEDDLDLEVDTEDTAEDEAELSALLDKKATEPEPVPTETPATKPVAKPAEKPVDTPAEKVEVAPEPTPVAKPVDDAEVRIQREVEERISKERQRIADAVIAKERNREDNALKKLRELEVATGRSYDQLLSEKRGQRIEEARERFAMDDAEAARYVAEQEELARYKAEREQVLARGREAELVNTYTQERIGYLMDAKTALDRKEYAKRWVDEIESITDGGKNGIPYKVALNLVLGQHQEEILAERDRAAEQRFVKNQGTPDKNATPVTPSGSGPDPGGPTAEQYALGRGMGLTDKEIREAYTPKKRK